MRGSGSAVVAMALAASLLIPGCARFDDRLAAPFTPGRNPGRVDSPAEPPSRGRDPSPPESSSRPSPPAPEPGPCTDPDPAVIATCLEPTSAATALPGSDSALVAEAGGRILRITPGAPQEEYAVVNTEGGRVAALTTSPHVDQDHMLFALIVGPGPSKLVRVVPGDVSKWVADLPQATAGGLAWVKGVLTVGVGGEVLAFPGYDGIGAPRPAESRSRDLGVVTGLCASGERTYVTVETARGGAVRRIDTPQAVWTWPDQRRMGACAAVEDAVAVALPDGQRVDLVPLADGAVRGQPQALAERRYGRFSGVAAVTDGVLVGTTTNKDGGAPVATDDRAVVLPSGGGGGDSRV